MNHTESSSEVEVDLLQIVGAIWKKLWIIALTALILGSLAFGYTKLFVTPMYKARTTLYVNNKNASESPESSISQSDLSASQHLVATYTIFLQSRSTLEEVILQAKLPYSYEQLQKMVSAEALSNTGAFNVVVTDRNPDEAALIANTIGAVLPEKISDFIPGSSVKIVDYAIAPERPFAPSAVKNTILGILVGVLISCGVVVVRELTDSQIHDSDYLTQNYDLPVLAVIPDLIDSQNQDGYFKEPPVSARHSAKGGKSHE